MENCAKAATVHFKYHLKYHLLAAVLFFCLMPFLMGTQYLNARESARTLEMYAALSGILFLTPVFLPDQDKNIRDLIGSKRMPYLVIHLIRLAENLLFLLVFVGAGALFLKCNRCEFPFWSYFAGTAAGALFLGGLGMFFYSVTDNAAVGYMVPLVYYMINFSGDKYVKNFYLFSMAAGDFGPKFWLAGAGAALLLGGLLWRRIFRFKP